MSASGSPRSAMRLPGAAGLASWIARMNPTAALRSVGPIGIEFGSDALYFAQMEVTGSGPRLRSSLAVETAGDSEALLSDPAALKKRISAALAEGRFSGRRAVGCLHSPDVKLMVLDYSAPGDAEEPAAIVRLVAERMDEAPAELVIDYLPIRALSESAEQRSALVAVARRTPIVERLEALRRAGLEIQALEIAPVAIRRLVGALAGGNQANENALVLYAGRERGHLSVLWGRRLVLYRELDFGETTVVERIAKALDLSKTEASALVREHGVQPPEAGDPAVSDAATSREIGAATLDILKPSFYELAEQIDRARVYTASKAHGASPDCAYLLGAFSQWPRADRLLSSLAGLPTRSLSPARDLRDPASAFAMERDGASCAEPEMTLAAGLALRGMALDG